MAAADNQFMSSSGLRIAYMAGVYPGATDTFIQREVAALRGRGVVVRTFSLRRPSDQEIVGPEQEAERGGTFYVQPPGVGGLVWAHLAMLGRGPGRYLGALGTALRVRAPGVKSLVWQV